MKRLLSLVVAFTLALALAGTLTFAAEMPVPVKKAPDSFRDKLCEIEMKATPTAKAELLDINTATEAELKAIPGIGDTYARKIIAARPYARKDQLKSRNVIPAPVYEKIKDKIIAKALKIAE